MTTVDMFSAPNAAPQTAADRVAELREKLNYHAHRYYDLDAPEISDAEYDKLYKELEALEVAHPELVSPESPTQRVGGKPLESFKVVRHAVPMLSIASDTTYQPEAALEFDASTHKALGIASEVPIEYCAELKFDGLAINLRYEQGMLVQAAARGDGETGEDVTRNVNTIKQIPRRLKGTQAGVIEVRGEVYIRRDDFEKYNEAQRELGLEPLSNPRNGAAGSLRQLNPAIAAARPLSFFAYGVGEVRGWHVPGKHSELLTALDKLGFPVCKRRIVARSGEALMAFYKDVLQEREALPFDIDGIVYKVNDRRHQEALGTRSRRLRWAFAHKFEPEEQQTVVEGIDIQVGRTGKLTPVAKLKSVLVGGVNVANATLHNEGETQRKDVRVGDTVIVRRAGDVIPEVLSVVPEKRPANVGPPFDLYKQLKGKCPSCGSPIAREEGGADWRCTGGLKCPEQQKLAILHFAQRTAMDIDGLGDEFVSVFVDRGLIHSAADLYHLRKGQLEGFVLREEPFTKKDGTKTIKIVRIQDELARKLIASIEASRIRPLNRFIYALGIRHVGETTARDLAVFFDSVELLRKTRKETLMLVPNLGEKTAEAVEAYFKDDVSNSVLDRLLETIHLTSLRSANQRPAVAFAELITRLKIAGLRTRTSKTVAAVAALHPDPHALVDLWRSGHHSLSREATAVAERLAQEPWRTVLAQLKDARVQWSREATAALPGEGPFAGKTVVLTGGFDTFSREELKAKLQELGAKVTGSVSAKTDYVIAGDSPGSKVADARSRNVAIVNEAQLLSMLES